MVTIIANNPFSVPHVAENSAKHRFVLIIMGVEKSTKLKLYIRLPVKIKEELQIKELHENIVEVHLPRQKSRRWCFIDFDSIEKLQEAKAALQKVKIEGKSIVIKPYKRGEAKVQDLSASSTQPLLHLLN